MSISMVSLALGLLILMMIINNNVVMAVAYIMLLPSLGRNMDHSLRN